MKKKIESLTDVLDDIVALEEALSKVAYIHGSDISRWRCVLTYMNKKKIKMPMGFSETLVDALAEMKIYLLEHGLMEVGR